jgi:hypothetical protein
MVGVLWRLHSGVIEAQIAQAGMIDDTNSGLEWLLRDHEHAGHSLWRWFGEA